MNIKLKPFAVQNHLIAAERVGHVSPSFPLSEVDATTLSELCDDFRREVFRKAGRVDPRGDK